jgi:hypothetical protein
MSYIFSSRIITHTLRVLEEYIIEYDLKWLVCLVFCVHKQCLHNSRKQILHLFLFSCTNFDPLIPCVLHDLHLAVNIDRQQIDGD